MISRWTTCPVVLVIQTPHLVIVRFKCQNIVIRIITREFNCGWLLQINWICSVKCLCSILNHSILCEYNNSLWIQNVWIYHHFHDHCSLLPCLYISESSLALIFDDECFPLSVLLWFFSFNFILVSCDAYIQELTQLLVTCYHIFYDAVKMQCNNYWLYIFRCRFL